MAYTPKTETTKIFTKDVTGAAHTVTSDDHDHHLLADDTINFRTQDTKEGESGSIENQSATTETIVTTGFNVLPEAVTEIAAKGTISWLRGSGNNLHITGDSS